MPNNNPPNPSKSTRYRWRKEARLLADEGDAGNISSDTDSSSGSSAEQQTKRRKGENESVDEQTLQSDNESTAENQANAQFEDAGAEENNAVDSESGAETEDQGEADDNGENDVDGENELNNLGGVGEEEQQQPDNEGLSDEDELLNVEDASSSSSESSGSDTEDDESEDGQESEEEQHEHDEPDGIPNGDVPLYPNARITLMESLIMILTLSLRFNLSGECITHILQLIEMHCPVGNVCKRTLFTFKNYFAGIGRKALILHYFCEYCMAELERKDSVCERCGVNTKVAFFIEIPLVEQLQRLFLRPGFVDLLMYRFNRVKKNPANYEDIYDGSLYKEQMENGFLSHLYNISLMWYTDGIQIFKSTKYSVWPLFFSINELSYKARTAKENTLLCGLWFGKSKPKPNLFLKPFRQTFQKFKTEGFRFNVPQGDPITVKGKLLCGTCDLQAKSLFLRSKLYSGFYGCAKCYSRGERAPAGRTTVHVHPFTPPANVRLRENKDVLQCARVARQRQRSHVLGIKGLSMLYLLMPDMIRGTGVDIMHQIFLGLCKLLTKFWFDPKFSGELFSCRAMIDVVNERLSSIKPPSFVQRMTRTLLELKTWKAKEYKLWFFYYSIPVLSGILPNEYLFHHMKLVSGISLLSQESICPKQVDRAEILLNEYVRDFQLLYTLRFMGMNVHLLTHLSNVVRELGPLWVCICFFYEDLNGQLVKLIHGAYQPGIQIMSSASLFMSLNLQLDRLQPNSIAKQFCIILRQFGTKFTTAEVIDEKTRVVGNKAFARDVPMEVIEMIEEQQNVDGGNFLSFLTLRKKGIFYNSAAKPAGRNRCSKYILCEHEGVPIIGEICHFVRWSQCNCVIVCDCRPAAFYCIVKVYERTPWLVHQVENVSIFYLFAVKPTERFIVSPCSQIVSPCFYSKMINTEYLAVPVNSLEYE